MSTGNCQADIEWTPPGTGAVTCTASTSPPNQTVGVNQPATVNVTVTNNSSTINLNTYQMRQQASDAANTGPTWNFGNFGQGQSQTHAFPVTARSWQNRL